MDRLKPILAVLKKHHFWVLCIVIVIVGVGLWWVTTGSLESAVAARNSEIQSKFSAMMSIANQPDHANEKVIQFIRARTGETRNNVFEAWQRLYQDQKAKNQLPELLTPGFVRAFENRDPNYEISRVYREEYMTFIGRHLPKLFEIGDILRPAEDASAGAAAGQNAATVVDAVDDTVPMIGVVEWDQSDQDRVRGYFNWPSTPSTAQVRLAQEDLWVYEALLRIIRNTNGPVKNRQDAAIKRILGLRIAQDAVMAWQSDGGPVIAGASGDAGAATPAPATSGLVSDAPSSDTDLVNNRYVNDDGLPLAAGQPHPYAEFKLMPIYLQLVMNQKRLTKLLVECANSSMPVEVRKVTVDFRPEAATAARGGARAGAAAFVPGAGARAAGGTSAAAPATTMGDMDMQVSIQGTIRIYNPPDEATLGTGAAAETPTEPAAPAEPAEAIPAEAASTGDTLGDALAGGPLPATSR